MLFLAGAAALGFLAHNAWYQHKKLEEAHARIDNLEQKVASPAVK